MITEKYFNAENLSIHTLESGNADRTIIFIHGNSSDAGAWLQQLNDSGLNSRYRLIAIDLPGHGKSAKSDNYKMQHIAGVLRTLIAEMQVTEYLLAGISFGTCIMGEAAPDLPGCKGIMLVSANITNNEHHPGTYLIPAPELMAMALESADDEMLAGFVSKLIPDASSAFIKEYSASYTNTDPAFRVALGAVIGAAEWTDEYANIGRMNVPVCIVFGGDEQVIQTTYLNNFSGKWRDRVFIVDEAGHFVNVDQPEKFNALLKEFAADVFK